MSMTATVTGKTGTALTMTAVVFNNLKSFSFDSVSKMLRLIDMSDAVTDVSIAAATTFTWVLSGSVYTVTIS